jgi:CDP-diacylglycerol--glycerol-3-phosphate 3-phosphatidyltransferase
MENQFAINLSPLRRLRTQWTWVAIVAALTTATGAAFLRQWWEAPSTLGWSLASMALCSYFLIFSWRNLSSNHRPGEKVLLPSLGAGNLLTLGRAGLFGALAGFLVLPRPEGFLTWAPGSIYILAGIVDILDGTLARRQNHVTLLGEKLDMSLDGLGVLLASGLVVKFGLAPGWYLLVGLARYLFLAGLGILTILHIPTYPLKSNPLRRLLAGLQMGFMGAVLIPVFSPAFTSLAAIFFAAPFLINFIYDWLVASGFTQLFSRRSAAGEQEAIS